MVYPAPAYYIRWNFDLKLSSSVVDTATFGLHAINPTVLSNWDLDAVANGCQAAFKSTLGDNTFGIFSSIVYGRSVDVYELGSDGKTLRKGSYPMSWQGNAQVSMPWQCAPVISLYDHNPQAFQSRPGRHRGRIYLPTLNDSVTDNSGLITSAKQTGLTTKAQQFIQAVRAVNVSGGNPVPQIQSKVDQTYREIKYVRVGRVVDTVRSRRNKLDEAYQQAAV